jgi:hypothetical protein
MSEDLTPAKGPVENIVPTPATDEAPIPVRDVDIPPIVRGVIGSKSWHISPTTNAPYVFLTVLSVDQNPPVEWGKLLVWRKADLDILRSEPEAVLTLAVTRADEAASAARPGGLRPQAVIIRVERPAAPASAPDPEPAKS